MFAHKKNYGRAGYVDDPLPNIVYMAIRMLACIVWLYYASSSTMWWFLDHFFLLSVWSPCYTLSSYTLSRKKKTKLIRGGIGSTWEHNFYMGTQNGTKNEI